MLSSNNYSCRLQIFPTGSFHLVPLKLPDQRNWDWDSYSLTNQLWWWIIFFHFPKQIPKQRLVWVCKLNFFVMIRLGRLQFCNGWWVHGVMWKNIVESSTMDKILMLLNQEWLRFFFFFCHSSVRSHPEAAGLQKHENVLLLLQHHPKEKKVFMTLFFFHMWGGSVGLVIPSMSHSQLLLISLTYLRMPVLPCPHFRGVYY